MISIKIIYIKEYVNPMKKANVKWPHTIFLISESILTSIHLNIRLRFPDHRS